MQRERPGLPAMATIGAPASPGGSPARRLSASGARRGRLPQHDRPRIGQASQPAVTHPWLITRMPAGRWPSSRHGLSAATLAGRSARLIEYLAPAKTRERDSQARA